MPASDPVAERIVLEFLRRYAEDARRGLSLGVEHYQALWPEHAERIALEWDALQQAEPDAGGADATAGTRAEHARRLGPYRLLEVLGRGGQGVVHRAVDERIGRTVALKLLPGLAPEQGLPARVQREVEAIARLDHPGLGVVYEAGVLEGQVYLAMRYVPGRSLAELLAERSAAGPRSDSRSRRDRLRADVGLVEKLARALHAAHEAGVVHRDVKPANVMLHESGEPVLLDFGLARADDSELATITASGELLGTTAYMAPERLRGEAEADRRVDVWALGVLLYELLTGRRPFEGPGVDEISRRIRVEEPTDPRRLERGIPRDLAVVLGTALEKDPGRRYPTALAFAEELARVRTGRPVHARPPNPLGRLRRWAWRHPALASLAALLLLTLLGSVWAAVAFAELAASEGDARAEAEALNTALQAQQAELRETAARERVARREAEALLVQRGAEQAELLRLSGSPGRRWEMLDVLATAATTRAELEPPLPDELPSLPRLRELAADALLTPDARRARVIQRSSLGAGRFSRDGSVLALTWVAPDFRSAGLRLLDTASGAELARMDGMFLMSDSFSVAVTPDREHLVVPRSDAVSLWRVDDVTHVQQYAIPPDVGVPGGAGRARTSRWEVAFLPDAAQVLGVGAPGGSDRSVPSGWALWDAASARLLQHHDAPPDTHDWFALSPDDRWLLLPGGPRTLQLHALPAGDDGLRRVATLQAPGVVRAATVAPGDAPEIHVLLRPQGTAPDADAASGPAQLPPDADAPPAAGVDHVARLATDGTLLGRRALTARGAEACGLLERSPDGRHLALATERGDLLLLDAASLRTVLRIPAETPRALESLRFGAGGRELLSHSQTDGSDAWELLLDTGLQRRLPLRPQAGSALAVSADGRLAAALAEGVRAPRLAWTGARDAPPPLPQLTLPAHAGPLHALAVDAAGTRVAAAGDDALWLWTLPDAQPAALPRPGAGTPVDLAFADDDALRLRTRVDDGAETLALVPLPTATASAHATTHALAHAPAHWITPDAALARALLVPREGARAPLRLATGALAWCALPDGAPQPLAGVPADAFKEVYGARLTPDGTRLVAVLYLPRTTDTGGPEAPDAVDHVRVLTWALPSGELLWSAPVDARVRHVPPAITPDGGLVLLAEPDGRVLVRDGATGAALLRWHAHRDGAGVAALHALGDGARVLTRATDGELVLWELARLRAELAALQLGF